MALHCNIGDKPRVEYQSKSKGKKIFKYDKAPLEIILDQVKKNTYGEDYDAKGFTIVYEDGSEAQVINYRTRTQGSQQQVQFWSCGNSDWDNRQPDGSYSVWYPLAPIKGIDNTRGCPPPIPPQDYRITIKYNGVTLFSDRSDTEITYVVACSNCPPGYCECKIPRYPGYCCIDKKELAQAINNVAAGKGVCCDRYV